MNHKLDEDYKRGHIDAQTKDDARAPETLSELFFPAPLQEGNQIHQEDRKRSESSKYTAEVHIYDLYDIQDRIQESGMCDGGGSARQRNFGSLFSVFVLKGANRNKMVPFNFLHRIAQRPKLLDKWYLYEYDKRLLQDYLEHEELDFDKRGRK